MRWMIDLSGHTGQVYRNESSIQVITIQGMSYRRAAQKVTSTTQRSRTSWQRFNATQPNELWQSDFTHWQLSGGEEVKIIGWLDDHIRYLLHLTRQNRTVLANTQKLSRPAPDPIHRRTTTSSGRIQAPLQQGPRPWHRARTNKKRSPLPRPQH